MGKQSRTRRERREHTTLQQHKQVGKTLQPPLTRVGFNLTRWSDVQLPEMVWAALLFTHGPRLSVIETLRTVCKYLQEHADELRAYPVTLSGFAAMPDVHRKWILAKLTEPPAARDVLSALALFESLPGGDDWKAVLRPSRPDDWTVLTRAIAGALSHQSQAATDCQWFLVAGMLFSGKLVMGTGSDTGKTIALYPHYGEPEAAGSSVRALAKGTIAPGPPDATWALKFWSECLEQTPCIPLEEDLVPGAATPGTTAGRLSTLRAAVIEHAGRTVTTTAPDPKHDTVFGLTLYVLSLLDELLRIGNSSTLIAQGALRTILESFVTLAYLAKKNDPQLWTTYRVFGSGQAKLVSLKFRDGTVEAPSSIDLNLVQELANEDMWEELLNIELGHWEKSSLRNLAIDGGAKTEYDQFYPWTSMFMHAHWAAIRAAEFDTCGNPLHRLHRIPRAQARALGDVVGDAVSLVDKILGELDRLYPTFKKRLGEHGGAGGA